MSYGRILETGHYIYPDGDGIHFDDVYVPNETINVFLAKIHDNRKLELRERIKDGRRTLKKYKIDMGD